MLSQNYLQTGGMLGPETTSMDLQNFITKEQEESIMKHIMDIPKVKWVWNGNSYLKYGYNFQYKLVSEMEGLPEIVVNELRRLQDENARLSDRIARLEAGDDVYYNSRGDYDNAALFRSEDHIPIPEWLTELHTKVNDTLSQTFNQIIIEKYQPGQGIHENRVNTKEYGDTIVTISLGSQSNMIFKKNKGKGKDRIEHCLERCSALILRGDLINNWSHLIMPRKSDNKIKRGTRISITFRNQQTTDCDD
jgi:alkylated DNA repair dioxygenase AlkB